MSPLGSEKTGRERNVCVSHKSLPEEHTAKILEIEPTRDAIHGKPDVASSSLAELWRAWRIESSDRRCVVFRKQSQLREAPSLNLLKVLCKQASESMAA